MNWYDKSVVYQIYPLGLTGAPYDNDGIQEHRILQLLENGWIEHLQKLGVNCVILNPVFESETHGYDTINYSMVDVRLGTNEDLRSVVDAFHEAGIKVLLDGVFNHVGRSFWAFEDVLENREGSEYADWFCINWDENNEFDDGFRYDNWAGVLYLVKLNHRNFDLNEYCADVIREWEDEYGIDGLRLDVAYCLDIGFLGYLRQVANELTEKRGEKFLLLGETMFGDYNLWMGDELCDTVTNYECYKGLWSSMNSGNMHEIAYALERQSGDKPWDLYTGKHLLNFVDNHDVPRIATQIARPELLKPLYGLLFGMCGVPCIYYGSEWGIEGEQKFGDHELRPAVEKPEWNELTDWIATLAKAKRENPALTAGNYRELQVQPLHLVFQRKTKGQRIIVAINIADEPVRLHFNAKCGRAVDLLTGEDHDFGGGSEVEPYSCHFWLCER